MLKFSKKKFGLRRAVVEISRGRDAVNWGAIILDKTAHLPRSDSREQRRKT